MVKKLSTQHKMILELLASAKAPMSAYEILHKLRNSGVRSPPTVYRALDKLQEVGLVHRIESLGAFVVCSSCHDDKDHTHTHANPFAICTSCGRVQELEDPSFGRALKKLKTGFLAQIQHKVFEISGLCLSCSKNEKASTPCSR